MDKLEIKVIVNWTNWQSKTQVLQINHEISDIPLEDIMPPRRPPMDSMDMGDFMQRQERRERVVHSIASNIAHAITEGLFDKLKK